MHLERKLFTAIWVAASCMLIVGCDGGSEDAASTTKVSAAESPIPNTSGVKATSDDGTLVYLLSEAANSGNTDVMKITFDPKKTGGDTSKLVSKSFLEFEGGSSGRLTAALAAAPSVQVFRCNIARAECIKIGHSIIDNGFISFEVSAGEFYAIR